MAGIYVYSDRTDLAAELISFARETGQPVTALAFTPEAAEKISHCGAGQVYQLQGASSVVESYSKAIAGLLKSEGASLFVVGATARGRDLAARAAGYLDCGMISDVSTLSCSDGKLTCERMMYGGAVVQKQSLSSLGVVTVGAGKFEAVQGEAEIIKKDIEADTRVELVETAPIIKEGADLNVAEKVVCVGMGLEKKEDIEIARELAQVLDAEIGCTRGVAEERHWLPEEQYIGISGVAIKPKMYLAMGVSGQVQHIVGIRDAKLIVAINSNEKAPIFRSADYGIVGDLYEIVPLLTAAIKNC